MKEQPGEKPSGRRQHRRGDYSDVFDFICDFKQAHDGNSPTLREIAVFCGFKSVGWSVLSALSALELDGKIVRVHAGKKSNARSLEIVGGRWLPPERSLV